MREIMEPFLSSLTTLRLGGRAIALLMPETREDLPLLSPRARELGGECFNLGRGSNLLARDGALPLLLISMKELRAIEILREDAASAVVRAEAGAALPRLLRFCLQHGLTGLEGLAGVPGSVGGGCAMNAGSFGSTLGDYVTEVEVWTGSGIRTVPREGLRFAYRSFGIVEPVEFVSIVSVTFTLTKGEKGGIFSCMSLNYLNKKTRQPLASWSAGCAFKNPPGSVSAGVLLEKAGMRGRRQGGMVFSPKHANFLVNEGNGTSIAALELLEEARSRVFAACGVALEPEIKIIPRS